MSSLCRTFRKDFHQGARTTIQHATKNKVMIQNPFAEQGPIRFTIGQFLIHFALYASMALAIGAGTETGIGTITAFWLLVICLTAAGLSAGLVAMWRQRHPRVDGDEFNAWVAKERGELTGPGWIQRMIFWGVALGVILGIPLGLYFAAAIAPLETTLLDRFLIGTRFLLGTLAWTIPAMFALRWVSLRFPGAPESAGGERLSGN